MNPEELKVLEERIKANPKSRSFLQLAEAYIEAGRKKEALELLKNGEEYYPYYLAARIAYGKLLREEGDADRSIEQFEFVNRTIPDNLIALKNLAPLYFDKSRLPEAKAMATSALALSPGDPEMTEIVKKVDAALAAQAAPPPPPPSPPAPEPALPPEPAEPLPAPPEEAPVAENPEPPVPEETIVEMPHELFESIAPQEEPEVEKPEPAASDSGSSLPQTETMGDLLVNQGHIEEALSVYEAVLAKDPGNKSVPEKLNSVRAMVRLTKPAEPVVSPEPPAPEPEPVEEIPAETFEEPPAQPVPAPEPEPEPEEVFAASPAPEPEPAEKEPEIESPPPPSKPVFEPETVAPSTPVTLPEGVAGKIVEAVQRRMGRAFTGYVRASLDGLSVETSDSSHWGDILAAEGVEIVRAVSDMTRMLGWGDLQGTVVWMDRATLYGLPIGANEALFLALKPGANIGLCRLLVAQTIEQAMKAQE